MLAKVMAMPDWVDMLIPPEEITASMLAAYVLLDIAIIVLLARLFGNLIAKINQPRVVGEILAGIILGPTILGETFSQIVSPVAVRGTLGAFGTLALILFMFLAGAEFDISGVKGRVRQAGLLAFLCVAIPALLGFPVATVMFNERYAGVGVEFLPFALLIGAALTVTAFPIMVHILMERGELNTTLGSLGVATAGIVTVLMFLYIGFATAVAEGEFGTYLVNLFLILLFGLLNWFVVRRLLARFLLPMYQNGVLSGTGIAVVFGGLVLSGLITHLLDIHAMIGGFLWGMILPPVPSLRHHLVEKIRDVTLVLLLPIFFAQAGFATDLKLLSFDAIPILLVMLLAAVGGKFLSAVPARWFGLSWNDTAVLGALFNTRGLLVLVVGLIGLELNLITTLTFTLFVLVALVTTLMTLPIMNFFSRP